MLLRMGITNELRELILWLGEIAGGGKMAVASFAPGQLFIPNIGPEKQKVFWMR